MRTFTPAEKAIIDDYLEQEIDHIDYLIAREREKRDDLSVHEPAWRREHARYTEGINNLMIIRDDLWTRLTLLRETEEE